jgi:tyrosinase
VSAHAHTPPSATVARSLRHRKNVENLSDAQLQALRNAFAAAEAIGDDRGFAHWAGIHGLPLPMYCQHGTRRFLPWHRAYLYFFELALRDLNHDAILAWWDWTSDTSHMNGIPRAFAAATVGGTANPLYRTTVPAFARQNNRPQRTSRNPASPAELPSADDVEQVLSVPDFLTFQDQLEQIHNAVHGWVGGTMGEIPWAAYDPIFFAHHTMIDRIWRLWQIRHPSPHLPDDLLNQALPPFPITVAQTLDIKALGYAYASATAHAVVT